MRAVAPNTFDFAGIDGARRQFRNPNLGVAVDFPEPADNALRIGWWGVKHRHRLDPPSVQFDKALDGIEAIEGEFLDRHLGAERGRFPCHPCGSGPAADCAGPMNALGIPCLEPARRAGLRFVGHRR